MNAAATPIVVSHYGNRTICWDAATLDALLIELRDERKAHFSEVEKTRWRDVAAESGEAEHNALMLSAEQIKVRATHSLVGVEPEHA